MDTPINQHLLAGGTLTAIEKRQEIHALLQRGLAAEGALEACWIMLGKKLVEFKEEETWRELNYPTFDHFMLELRETYHRGRTQLYMYLGVAERLGPIIDGETLEQIGVSKANVLCSIVRAGQKLPQALIEDARKPEMTIKELRAKVGELLTGAPYEKGTWFDFGGCYFTDEEKKAFTDMVKTTIALLGIKPDTPEHIQRKMIFLTWGQEFHGTHAAEVYGPEPEAVPEADDAGSAQGSA